MTENALKILKQFIDASIRMGVAQNLEGAKAICDAWQIIKNELDGNK